jgi:Mrp family chromosome partitioning ATPase
VKDLFDVILIDTPPVLQHADAIAATAVVPNVVLVIEAGRTRYEMLDRVRSELSDAGATIVGNILNKHKRFIPGWIYRALVR